MKFFRIMSSLFLLSIVIISCSKETSNENENALDNKSLIYNSTREADPTIRLSYVIDEFRLKRPKHNCNRGFWFCVKGHWEIISWDINNQYSVYKDPNGQVHILGELIDDQVKLRFPIELNETHSSSDLELFSVDEEYEFYPSYTMKIGQYDVNIIDNEYVVFVDLL